MGRVVAGRGVRRGASWDKRRLWGQHGVGRVAVGRRGVVGTSRVFVGACGMWWGPVGGGVAVVTDERWSWGWGGVGRVVVGFRRYQEGLAADGGSRSWWGDVWFVGYVEGRRGAVLFVVGRRGVVGFVEDHRRFRSASGV